MRTPRNITTAIMNRLTLKADRGPIGVGLIGIGGWGGSNAVHIMRSHRFSIQGLYDINQQAARTFAGRYKIKFYDRLDPLLADSAVQAVCITVPNPVHEELVRAAAGAGKHVFIEKPLASNPEVCRELGAHCKEKQVVLQVGHQMRRDPVFCEIKRILTSGVLGEPLHAQGVYTLDRRTRDDWRRDGHACPGGSMEQLGVHLLDSLIYLLGHPLKSHGWARNIPIEADRPDWSGVLITFPREVKATICTSFSSPKHLQLEMFFENGRLATDGKTLRIVYRNDTGKTCKPRGVDGSISQFVEFADCIEHGKQPETGAEEAAVVMEAVQSMFSQSERGLA